MNAPVSPRHLVLLSCLVFLFTMCMPGAMLRAQDVPKDAVLTELILQNGEVYRGYVLGSRADTLQFRTPGGAAIALPVSQVREMRPLVGEVQPVTDATGASPADASARLGRPATSLFIQPTAYPLPAGEVHLGLYELFFASGNVGIADFAEVHAGTLLLPGAFSTVLYGGMKLAPYHDEHGAVALGTVFQRYDDETNLMFYGVGTLNLGASWLSAGYTMDSDSDVGIVTLGFDLPLSRITRLMTEVWIPTEGGGALIGVGARVETSFITLDIGFYVPTSQRGSYLIYLPWLGGTFVL